MRSHLVVYILGVSLVIPVAVARPTTVAAVQAGPVQIRGPRGESTPVVNENNQLQLRVEGAGAVSRWSTDSPEVATVTSTGLLSGRRYGFATITAETPGGTARVIVVVVRKTPRRASRAQGDTKTDTGGNVYLSSPLRHVIFKAGASGSGVLAGTPGQAGYQAGDGTQARFNVPTGLGVDQSARGGVYVADSENHCVRRIRPNGSVEVVAGLPEQEGRMVTERTPITEAVLSGPRGVVVVGGNLMVSDTENHCVWYVDLERREVRLVAGEPGVSGSRTENGRGRAARFNRPSGLAVSTDGRLVAVADTGNDAVRLISVGQESGQAVYDVTTLGLGSSRRGAEVAKLWGEDRGEDALAFEAPESVSIDGVGNVYVIDAESAVVVTRREGGVEQVELAQAGTLGDPASVTLAGTQAFVLDAGAATDEAVNVVEVGAPTIDRVSVDEVGLAGGEEVVVDGTNFAPETVLTFGDAPVLYEVESARRIRFVAPALTSPGARTLTVATRGGVAQRALTARGRRLEELAPGEVTTVAGGVAGIGDGGAAAAAGLYRPNGVAVDAAGNLFVADSENHRVRRVDAATARITTVAGTGVRGFDGDDKPATAARLSYPNGVAVDDAGDLYIADSENHRVRRVDAVTGRISTVAGTGGGGYDGDDKPATAARLNYPLRVALDAEGNLFVADYVNNRIRRVDAATGRISTVAGTGARGYDGDGGPATAARLNLPAGVAVDAAGDVFVSDNANHRVRRVDHETGRIATVAGTGEADYGGDGGPATAALLAFPEGLAVDAAGNLFISDYTNSRVRRVDAATGIVTTVAGTDARGYDGDGGPATSARLSNPATVAVDAAGNLFVADSENHRIRRVDGETGRISTVAGTGAGSFDGDDKPATGARLFDPTGVAVDAGGNLFVTDSGNNRIRRVDAATGRISTVAGTGEAGFGGDDGPATAARLNRPAGVAVDAAGNLYVADAGNHRVRRVDAAGRVTTVAGTGEAGYGGDDGPAASARLNSPSGVGVDAAGTIFVADTANHRVRRVDASGRIATAAGTGAAGDGGDGGPATAARLSRPAGVAVDAAGHLYVADTGNHRVRRVDAATGRITTVAGTGLEGYDGDDRPAASARLTAPSGVAVDAGGDVFVADTENERVRCVDAATGRITTVTGTGLQGYDGDDGAAISARLFTPFGVAVGAGGDVFVADTFNYAVRGVRQPGAAGGGAAPSVQRVSFADAAGKLVIRGASFGASGAVVRVNGVDVSARVRRQADRKIVVRGSAGDLALRGGGNEITVTVNGRTSAVFPLFR